MNYKLDKDDKVERNLIYSDITDFITPETYEAHKEASDRPVDTRKRPWDADTRQAASRGGGQSRGKPADNGKAEAGSGDGGKGLPTSARRRPGGASV